MNIEILREWLTALLAQVVAYEALSSPLTFAVLIATALIFVWLALGPSRAESGENERISGYLAGRDIVEEAELRRSFLQRAVLPFMRRLLKTLGALTPMANLARVETLVMQAGSPSGLTAPDILGMQVLAGFVPAALYLAVGWFSSDLISASLPVLLRNAGILLVLGFLGPRLWLSSKADARKRDIMRNFSNALDLLSVSVDAGLGLDSAIVHVCERWHNALTEELRRVTMEIRVGTPRNTALQRMADRTGVGDLETFVGILIQSTELGVSIAETLHSQAAQVRVRRRQRSEELARQASVKMVFALVFFIFPALLVVLLGPGVPRIFEALGGVGTGGGPLP
jgi:tight adherence protein C